MPSSSIAWVNREVQNFNDENLGSKRGQYTKYSDDERANQSDFDAYKSQFLLDVKTVVEFLRNISIVLLAGRPNTTVQSFRLSLYNYI